jgi:hypothetical protein
VETVSRTHPDNGGLRFSQALEEPGEGFGAISRLRIEKPYT